MPRKLPCFICVLALAWGCTSPTPTSPPDPSADLEVQASWQGVWDRPDYLGHKLGAWEKGTLLRLDATDAVRLGPSQPQQPCGLWLQARAGDGLAGWTPADTAALRLIQPAVSWTDLWLQAGLAPPDYAQYQRYLTLWQSPSPSAAGVAEALGLARNLHHSLHQQTCAAALCHLPAAAWPGWQRMYTEAGECSLGLYWPAWRNLAAATPQPADEAWVDLMFQVYPVDSLDSDWPVWRFPVSPTTSYSLLGRGIHTRLLEALEQQSAETKRWFVDERRRLKAAILRDICNPDGAYWENQTRILAELDSLLAKPWPLLDAADRAALRHRHTQFMQADTLGIRVDYRSGRFDD